MLTFDWEVFEDSYTEQQQLMRELSILTMQEAFLSANHPANTIMDSEGNILLKEIA